MLTRIRNLAVFCLQPDLSFGQALALPQVHYFGNDVDLCALGSRPQIRAVQVATDMARVPEAVATDGSDCSRGADVKDQCYSAAVQISWPK